MKKKAVSGIMITLMLIGMLPWILGIQPVKADWTWTVNDDGPADFHTIQEAIDAASSGDTIYVYNGTYYENIVINKNNLTLLGEDKDITVVDGNRMGTVVYVTANNVILSGFTLRDSGPLMPDSCIRLYYSSGSSIRGNTISNYWGYSNYDIRLEYSSSNNLTQNLIINGTTGILLWDSSNNTISKNIITNSKYGGIGMAPHSDDNTVVENTIINNKYGMSLDSSNNNIIYHNLFNNTDAEIRSYFSLNIWDDGYPSGGNYWSDYEEKYPYAEEIDGSGIWDTPYIIEDITNGNNKDNYPLVEPWSPEPPTPTEAIEELIETIDTWDLPKGTENSLTSKLEEALHLLDIGNENGAIHKLMDFMSQVEAQRGKKITDDQADYLIAEAQRIIDLIEG